jgi:HSP20 family protein
MSNVICTKSRAYEEEMRRLYSEFSQMKHRVMLDALNVWHPATDVCETEDEYIITCEIAGVRKEDVVIQMGDDVITIAGVRKEKRPVHKAVFHNLEINYGPFERNIHIPRRFVGAKPRARFKEGILTVRLSFVSPKTIGIIEVEIK